MTQGDLVSVARRRKIWGGGSTRSGPFSIKRSSFQVEGFPLQSKMAVRLGGYCKTSLAGKMASLYRNGPQCSL